MKSLHLWAGTEGLEAQRTAGRQCNFIKDKKELLTFRYSH